MFVYFLNNRRYSGFFSWGCHWCVGGSKVCPSPITSSCREGQHGRMGHLEGNSIVWWDACSASFYDESMLCGRYLVRVYVMWWWYLDHTKIQKMLPWEHYENAWLGDTIVWQESLWICLWGQHGGGFQGRFYLLYITAIMLVVINKIFHYHL